MKGTLTVQQAGNSVVTDLGRFRGPHFGLPVNGALDQQSARIANVLAGNPDGAPLIELTALDFRVVTDADTLVAVTGAPASVTVNGSPRPQWEPVSAAVSMLTTMQWGIGWEEAAAEGIWSAGKQPM